MKELVALLIRVCNSNATIQPEWSAYLNVKSD
jgi:hypothetical protein